MCKYVCTCACYHICMCTYVHTCRITYMYIFETIFATKLQQTYLDRIKWSDRILNSNHSDRLKISASQLLFGNVLKLDRGIFLPPSERLVTDNKPLSKRMSKLIKAVFLKRQLKNFFAQTCFIKVSLKSISMLIILCVVSRRVGVEQRSRQA